MEVDTKEHVAWPGLGPILDSSCGTLMTHDTNLSLNASDASMVPRGTFHGM